VGRSPDPRRRARIVFVRADTGRSGSVVWTVAYTNFAVPFMFAGVGVALPHVVVPAHGSPSLQSSSEVQP